MRHAREPDSRPADEPGRDADGRDQPPVTRSGRRAARAAAAARPPSAGFDAQPPVVPPLLDWSEPPDYADDNSPPASDHTVFYPALPKRADQPHPAPDQTQSPPPVAVGPSPARYAPPPAPTYAPRSVPEQPKFSPLSPARGYDPRPASDQTAPDQNLFPIAPTRGRSNPTTGQTSFADPPPVSRHNPRPAPDEPPFPVSPAYGYDARPVSGQINRPPGHSRVKTETKTTKAKGTGFRGPRSRNRGAVIVAVVVATLVSANVGLMVIRSDESPDSANLPQSAGLLPSSSPAPTAISLRNTSTRLGVFVGTNSAKVPKFETWLGRNVDDVLHFDDRKNWDQIANPDISQWKDKDYRLIFAVPMLPSSERPTKEASMRAGARGEYNKHFTSLAKKLVASGQEGAVLRIGWEFNLKSWTWGIKDHEVFIKFFRHVVNSMRAVPGAKFKIDWNVNNGYNPYDATKYYPGDKYVDYVGVDAYDLNSTVYPYPKKCNAACRSEIQQEAWDENIYGGEHGLRFWAAYAAKHKKPLSIPEFGLWTVPDGSDGGDDNPIYIEQMHNFITWAPNNVAYAAYFNYDGPDGPHSVDAAFPIAGKVFKKLFGEKKAEK